MITNLNRAKWYLVGVSMSIGVGLQHLFIT